MEPTAVNTRRHQKIVVIMGPTGAGKSRLSIDLATCYYNNSEIINSDKMQVYRGLDITTNKITMQERRGIRHHLLGSFDPTESVINPFNFRQFASEKITDIVSRGGLPVLVGGSNSFIYSLLAKNFDPKSDVFNRPDPVSSELRYKCCFIWVDVSFPVLDQYLCKRVDEMLGSGMLEELKEYFGSGQDLRVKRNGLGQAIGVPELEGYVKDGLKCEEMYEEAVRRIKDNTCQLGKRQVGKIVRLKKGGWNLNRIDATEVFKAVMTTDDGGGRVAEIWEKQVVETSVKIVKQFLDE
ncbi:adenylate isopentenyltransferase-like [Rutidosis leptorrhynchoides]|uniref:adenylate isopentenyltransferase-like n=1 Tax=Rutidosis leptorrhynchoides TaxID=125765 RepID=UPI003A990DDC